MNLLSRVYSKAVSMSSPLAATSPTRLNRFINVGAGFVVTTQAYIVEAAYFMFFLSRHMLLPLFQEYVHEEVHKEKHSHDGPARYTSPANQTAIDQFAQKESAVVVLSLQIAEGLPAVISVIILGALSDRTGRRRILLWLPALGNTIYALIYIMIQYTGWSLDGLFMAAAIRGLSGSMTAFLAGASYYAINAVKPHQRSSRLALQELLNGAAYAIGNLMVGFWVTPNKYLQPLWFCLICSLISFLLSFFLVPETQADPGRSPSRRELTGNCCIDTFKPMAKFFRCKGNMKLVRVWLAIIAFQTYTVVHIGQINTLVLYFLEPPMGWEATKIGVFLAVAMVCAAFATGLVPPILRNYVTDTHIAIAGYFSKALGTLWIAVIHNGAIIYIAIFLMVLELLPFPMMRALVAKGTDPSEQGSLFALMHSGESISYFLAPLMFTSIYAKTLDYYAGFVFVVSALLLLIPFCFTLGIRYIDINYPDQVYETMDGENELISNELPPGQSVPPHHDNATLGADNSVPKVMTTQLSSHPQDMSTVTVPGESV